MQVHYDRDTLETHTAEQVIDLVLGERPEAEACITCSFQAAGMVVLHLLRQRVPEIPVLFLDTGYHFPQTYDFRDQLAREWKLNLVNITPVQTVEQQESALGILYLNDPTRCCQLRKVEPLIRALAPFEIWFTGLRREQSVTRKDVRKAELHCLPTGKTLTKVNPLAGWSSEQVWEYTRANNLRYLPQYDEGYLSIGCQPCTALPEDPANPRSGRWGGRKLECGIHTFSEQPQ
jgi:phosphoadenosine phosphosulfate reductase